VLQGSQRRPSHVLMILRGISQGTPTAPMARELGCDRRHLLALRHRLQEFARIGRDCNPLGDPVVEADEMYQNAGEKRDPARRPGRSAATACQQPSRPRHVRDRPAADRRSSGSGVGGGAVGGDRIGRGDRVGRCH
jgi:hypothetical protein